MLIKECSLIKLVLLFKRIETRECTFHLRTARESYQVCDQIFFENVFTEVNLLVKYANNLGDLHRVQNYLKK